MYTVYVVPAARKSARKLPIEVQTAAREAFQTLAADPLTGEKLSGSLQFLRSYHFKVTGTEYRIAYHVQTERSRIIVHLIHSRENFYEKLKRIFH